MTFENKQKILKHPKRPNIVDYTTEVFDDFIPLQGDRLSGEDMAIYGGIAKIYNKKVMVIGHRRGKTTNENINCRFGMPNPQGYRKAIRLAKYADKFNMPIITFVDTAGAYPGLFAEENGQGSAIANCIYEFAKVKVPVLSIITGEGGSGGALALATANEVFMLENAVYSVISPRGCASILFKDAKREEEAYRLLKITAEDLHSFGIAEGIISEDDIFSNVKHTIIDFIKRYNDVLPCEIKQKRQKKFRQVEMLGEKNYVRTN